MANKKAEDIRNELTLLGLLPNKDEYGECAMAVSTEYHRAHLLEAGYQSFINVVVNHAENAFNESDHLRSRLTRAEAKVLQANRALAWIEHSNKLSELTKDVIAHVLKG